MGYVINGDEKYLKNWTELFARRLKEYIYSYKGNPFPLIDKIPLFYSAVRAAPPKVQEYCKVLHF